MEKIVVFKTFEKHLAAFVLAAIVQLHNDASIRLDVKPGELRIRNVRLAAEHFIGMLRDDLHLKVVLGLRPPPGPREIEETVRHAVDIFLDGCRPGDAPRGRPRKPSRARRP